VVGAGTSRLLQAPQAQRLEREVADFALGSAVGASSSVWGTAAGGGTAGGGVSGVSGAAAGAGTPGAAGTAAAAQEEKLGVREFFALKHERVLRGAIEEALRDCTAHLQRHSFNRIQADWEEAKAQIMSSMAPQRLGAAAIGSGLSGVPSGVVDASVVAMAAPPQDAAIIDALLREPISLSLVQRIGRLSCDGCAAYRSELEECWGIICHQLEPTPRAVLCGSLMYLQNRFATEVKAAVYGSGDMRLGGLPDAWSIVKGLGRVKFGVSNFPSNTQHVWYAAYVAARSGFTELLGDLPERAAPCSDRCPMLRTVCTLMAQRLQATAIAGKHDEFTAASGADAADLLRADLSEEGDVFHDVLVSLLLGRIFALGRLPDGTAEDWLWYRLHTLHKACADNDKAPEFTQQLEALRQHAVAIAPSHYDPVVGAGSATVGAGPSTSGIGAGAAGGAGHGFHGLGDVLGPSGIGMVQTLNFVKVLLLTAQFGRAVQQLRSQDRCLRAPALHIALVLHRAGTLAALAAPEPPPSVAGMVCDYASHFACGDQLQYFRILDLPDRVQALQRLLLRGGIGTNDELLGYIDANGRHRPGLLERSLHEDGLGDGAEFVDLCARAGRTASEHGQYRESIRLLHLGRCYSEVLNVLCRCLRLPVWREPAAVASAASEEVAALGTDVQRFFGIYERNLDRYALSSQAWNVARKLYAARTFHALCDQGRPEAALDIFDREQLLPFSPEQPAGGGADNAPDVLAEQPQIVSDYVRILRHAASQGTVVAAALRARVRQLQAFLAAQAHRLALDQETAAALASLALC